MTKKGNNIIGILFIVLVVCILVGFFAISMIKNKDTAGYFNKNDNVVAESIYEKVMGISEENYPITPEEVVTLYTEAYKLLYGDKIKDTSIVPNILEKQRILLSDEILTNNPIEEQEKNVLSSMENIKNNKVRLTSVEIKPVMYDPSDSNIAYVKVDKKDNFFQTYYYLYYLERQSDEKWKITGWYNTDENYNIIEQE